MRFSSSVTDLTRPMAAALAVVVWLGGVPSAGARTRQTPAPPAVAAPPQAPLPVPTAADLERIKRLLRDTPAIRLDERQLKFYMEIVASQPRFQDWIGDTRGQIMSATPVTHREFLQMVTPKLVNSSAGITAEEWLQFSIVNAAAESLVKRAVQEIRKARTEAEVGVIRDRINLELLALKRGGR